MEKKRDFYFKNERVGWTWKIEMYLSKMLPNQLFLNLTATGII